ncbi:MAG: hypothetical protein IIA05_11930 [Proteobacteria bacterium]|nr:hypothetical protein [Pseudomonadota bacterium]
MTSSNHSEEANRVAAIRATDKLTKNLGQIKMLSDLLSGAEDPGDEQTMRTAGETIFGWAYDAEQALTTLSGRCHALEGTPKSKATITPIDQS